MTDEPRAIGPDDGRDDDGGAEPLGDPPNRFVLRAVRAVLFLYMLPLVAVAMLVVGVALAAWRTTLAVERLGRRLLGKGPGDRPGPGAEAGAEARPVSFPIAPHRREVGVVARRPSRRG
ncbi:MAG TPA: hypothetical protein VG406_14395 [Isosphaeraceae bacterium]|jgi:hypothetical protein|nr:hypothetical protein [Isosphaeraceae bacterium]